MSRNSIIILSTAMLLATTATGAFAAGHASTPAVHAPTSSVPVNATAHVSGISPTTPNQNGSCTNCVLGRRTVIGLPSGSGYVPAPQNTMFNSSAWNHGSPQGDYNGSGGFSGEIGPR
jgi:hypothetical protein